MFQNLLKRAERSKLSQKEITDRRATTFRQINSVVIVNDPSVWPHKLAWLFYREVMRAIQRSNVEAEHLDRDWQRDLIEPRALTWDIRISAYRDSHILPHVAKRRSFLLRKQYDPGIEVGNVELDKLRLYVVEFEAFFGDLEPKFGI
jgi:hypothetical protein